MCRVIDGESQKKKNEVLVEYLNKNDESRHARYFVTLLFLVFTEIQGKQEKCRKVEEAMTKGVMILILAGQRLKLSNLIGNLQLE